GYELLLVRREAHDGPGHEVEHARQRVTGLGQIGDGADVIVDGGHQVLRLRFGRRLPGRLLSIGGWLRASVIPAGLAPGHIAVVAEGVLEALPCHRAVVVSPANGLAAKRIRSHERLLRSSIGPANDRSKSETSAFVPVSRDK